MKKIFSLLVVGCIFFTSEIYADQNLFNELIRDNSGIKPEEHQKVAKFFGYYMFPENKEGECQITQIFSYVKDEQQIIYHIGWYAEGYIVTQINGSKAGHQTVILGDTVIGISYPCKIEENSVFNKYFWGEVYTTSKKQEINGHL